MENKKKLPLVITKVAIDVVWYLNIISALITLFIFIKGAQGPHHHLSIAVEFKGATLERYYPTHHVNDADITMQAHTGNAILDTTNPFAEIPMIAGFVLYRFLLAAILFNLRKIFTTFYHNQPFDHKNVTRIKIIALYIALYPLVQLIFSLIDYSNFTSYKLASQFTFRWGFDVRDIGIAAIVYIVAEIFNYGFELKKENEEFV